jgi:excisionase family DNA binding protein
MNQEKRYLTPGTAAQILNIHRETLRRYDQAGLIVSQRTKGGHRRYPEDHIFQLKETGLPALPVKEASKQSANSSDDSLSIVETVAERASAVDKAEAQRKTQAAELIANLLNQAVKPEELEKCDRYSGYLYCLGQNFGQVLVTVPEGKLFYTNKFVTGGSFKEWIRVNSQDDIVDWIENKVPRKNQEIDKGFVYLGGAFFGVAFGSLLSLIVLMVANAIFANNSSDPINSSLIVSFLAGGIILTWLTMFFLYQKVLKEKARAKQVLFNLKSSAIKIN